MIGEDQKLKIKKIFSQFGEVTDADLGLILSKVNIEQFNRKEILLDLDSVCTKMYFVLEGCLRLYYLRDGVERNCFFFHENMFCTAFGSFMMERPSNQILQTIEDTTCIAISFNDLNNIYLHFPKMNYIVRKILEERYTNAHDIISAFILYTPEERYQAFIDNYPLLVNRIPEYHIASFIGITPKSFSRLKRRRQVNQKKVTKGDEK